jgi:hypothetical protein
MTFKAYTKVVMLSAIYAECHYAECHSGILVYAKNLVWHFLKKSHLRHSKSPYLVKI